MKVKNYVEEIELPQGVTAQLINNVLHIKGKNGEIKREFKVAIVIEGNVIKLNVPLLRKNEKTVVSTMASHINNMILGAQQNYVYKLKICSGHFPMNVAVSNTEFTIKNFIGEKKPRLLKLVKGVQVKVEGEVIVVESNSVELAGMTAGAIERLASRPGFDKRVFQQGIFITDKPM